VHLCVALYGRSAFMNLCSCDVCSKRWDFANKFWCSARDQWQILLQERLATTTLHDAGRWRMSYALQPDAIIPISCLGIRAKDRRHGILRARSACIESGRTGRERSKETEMSISRCLHHLAQRAAGVFWHADSLIKDKDVRLMKRPARRGVA
jgi:hypothetical protein